MSSSQDQASQIPTLSQRSKAYKPWQKEEVERLIGWLEGHVDLTEGKQSEWTKRAKEEVFSLDDHISTDKIRYKTRNLQTAYNKANRMRLQLGWGLGLAEEDVEQSIRGRLEKTCQFFWRLDGIWGRKQNTTQFDSLQAPDAIMINDTSRSPGPNHSPAPAPPPNDTRAATVSRHGSPTRSTPTGSDSDFDQDTQSRRSEHSSTRCAPKSTSSAIRPNLTERLLEAQSAQYGRLFDKRLQHEREMHAAFLSTQERIAEIMAASSERAMQAVLTALTSYRRRPHSSRCSRCRSRSASPARREA